MSNEQGSVEEAKLLKLLSNPPTFYAAFKKDLSILPRAIHLILMKCQTSKEAAGKNFVFILHAIHEDFEATNYLMQHEGTKKTCHDFIARVADNTLPEVFKEEDLPMVKKIGDLIWGVLTREAVLKQFQEAPRPLTFSARMLMFRVLIHCVFLESSVEILFEEYKAYCYAPNPSPVVVKMMLDVLHISQATLPMAASILMKVFPNRAPKELWDYFRRVLFDSPIEETITYCHHQLQLLSEICAEEPPDSIDYKQYVKSLIDGLLRVRDGAVRERMIHLAFQLPSIEYSLTTQSKEKDFIRTTVGALQNHIALHYNAAPTLSSYLLELMKYQDYKIVDAALHSLAYVVQDEDMTRDLIVRTIAALNSTFTAENACLLIKHTSYRIVKEGLFSEAVAALHKALLERPVPESKFTESALGAMVTLLKKIPCELEAWKTKEVHLTFEAMNVCASFKNRNIIAEQLPKLVSLIDKQSIHSLAPIVADIVEKLKVAFSQDTFYTHMNLLCYSCRDVPYSGCILKGILLNHLLPNLKAGDNIVRVIANVLFELKDEGIPYLTEELLDTFLPMETSDSTTYTLGLAAFAKLLEPNRYSSLAPRILKLMPKVLEYCWTEAEESNCFDEHIREAIAEYLQYAPQDIALEQAQRASGWLKDCEEWESRNTVDDIAQLASHLAIAVPSYMGALFPSFFDYYFDDEDVRTSSSSPSHLKGLTIMISMRIFDYFHCSKATYVRKLQNAQSSPSEDDDEPPAKKRRITSSEEETEEETEAEEKEEDKNVSRAIQLLLAARPSTKSIQLQREVSWIFGMFKNRMPAELWDNKDPEVRKVMSFQPHFQCIPTKLVDVSVQTKSS